MSGKSIHKAQNSRGPDRATIETALKKCVDPELGIDIVSLGLVYDVVCEAQSIQVVMTLTTPACPLAPYFLRRVPECIGEVAPDAVVEVRITFDPPWSPDKMGPDIRAMLGR